MIARRLEDGQLRPPSAASATEQPEWLFDYQLMNGPLIRFRHASPADAEMVASSMRTVSRETLFHRFFSPIQSLPLSSLRQLLNVDRSMSICLVGQIEDHGQPRIICGARYMRESISSTMAECAMTVHDEFQHHGIGTFLLRKLAEYAAEAGVKSFEGFLLYSNRGMRRLVAQASPKARWYHLEDMIRVVMPVHNLLNDHDPSRQNNTSLLSEPIPATTGDEAAPIDHPLVSEPRFDHLPGTSSKHSVGRTLVRLGAALHPLLHAYFLRSKKMPGKS